MGSNPTRLMLSNLKGDNGYCLLCTQYEVRKTKQNWLARCQYNVTGWGTILAYDILQHVIPVRQCYKEGHWVPLLQIGTSFHRFNHCPIGLKQVQKTTLRQSGKNSDALVGH